MCLNRLIAAAPTAFPSSPGSGHTFVSCPHPSQPCPRNIPWPKNDCPGRAFSSNAETDETAASMPAPSNAPANPIGQPSAVPSLPDAHDPAERSAPPPRTRQTRISPQYRWPPLLSAPRSKSETGTSAPIQHDTDNAIACVITCEICSLLPPYASWLRQQLGVRIAVSGLVGHSHPGPAQPAPMSPPVGWDFLLRVRP